MLLPAAFFENKTVCVRIAVPQIDWFPLVKPTKTGNPQNTHHQMERASVDSLPCSNEGRPVKLLEESGKWDINLLELHLPSKCAKIGEGMGCGVHLMPGANFCQVNVLQDDPWQAFGARTFWALWAYPMHPSMGLSKIHEALEMDGHRVSASSGKIDLQSFADPEPINRQGSWS